MSLLFPQSYTSSYYGWHLSFFFFEGFIYTERTCITKKEVSITILSNVKSNKKKKRYVNKNTYLFDFDKSRGYGEEFLSSIICYV